MQAKYYIQKLMMNRVQVDVEYLGADTEVSPEMIYFIALKQEVDRKKIAKAGLSHVIKLDEYELAMAS